MWVFFFSLKVFASLTSDNVSSTLIVRGGYEIRIPRENDSEAETHWSVLFSFRRYELSSKKELLNKKKKRKNPKRTVQAIHTNTNARAHNVKTVHRHNYMNETSAHMRIYMAKIIFTGNFRWTCAIGFHEMEIVKFVALRQSIGVFELRKPKHVECHIHRVIRACVCR